MAKRNKEFEYRMQGIMHASEVVKRSGLEGLEKDILNRGILRVPLSYTDLERKDLWSSRKHSTKRQMKHWIWIL
ncbi:MAG: hypothetical protein ACLUP8_04505 [Ruminococcus sp.]|uniref:hypothetical protein n=1 Tax=Ruminococcus sp. TaxID=41978 RepID=UPI0039965058